jgi:arginase family enzyme
MKRRAPAAAKKAAHPQPVDALVLPRFSGIATFMRLPHIPRAHELDVALIGIPYDGGTTYRPGPRFGPRHVREQSAIIRSWNPALNLNPFEKHRVADYGDLSINPLSIDDTFERITSQLDAVLKAGARAVCVGGDHSILLPILRSVHKRFGPVGLIQFDSGVTMVSG